MGDSNTMDEAISFDKLLEMLRKPQRGKKLVQILTALRKHVNTADHQQAIETIRKCKSLKYLILCTQFDGNVRVIDLALSIIGNCCTNASVVTHVVNELNILQNLTRILDKHKKDSIQGRVFRIFGNICDAMEPIRLMQKESKVISHTIDFLKGYARNTQEEVIYSVPTISMALRFVRKMLSMQTYSLLVQEHSLIPTLGMVLIKCTNQWKQNKNDDVLVTDFLKILQIITSTSYKYNNLIPDLRTTELGDSLQSLSDIILLQPERITKVILRLARLSKNLSDMPIETIITNLITQVEQQSNKRNGPQMHLLSCVSNLMDHIGFHDVFKNANIVQTLVKLLQDYQGKEDWSIQCCIYISQSLNKCKYNEVLINSQLNANIIPIITDMLVFLSGKSAERISLPMHDKKEYKMSKCKKMKPSERDVTEVNIELETTSDFCGSPDSCSDISSLGPFSPAATSNFTGDDSDSDNYSPLCSESECDDENRDWNEDVQEDLIPSDTDDNQPAFTQNQMQLRTKLRSELCSLLKLYCTIKPLHQQLGDVKVITIITNLMLDPFINKEMNEKEYYIIKAISETHNFLIPLMQSDVISQVYEVLDTKHIDCCTDCDIMQARAEKIISNFLATGNSDGIKGDIAHILLAKDNSIAKEKLALSIPYVIRNKVTLVKLLHDCGGLNVLINLLKEESNNQMQAKCIKSICTLASINLKIKNPVQKKSQLRKSKNAKSSNSHIKVGQYTSPEQCDTPITFLLDDGSIVKADGRYLDDKSDYFNALLRGSFLESETREIQLKDVSSNSLKCLLELLKCDYTIGSSFSFDYQLDTILEVILLSDRFLLFELNNALSYHVEQLISLRTVPTIYKWSIESGTNVLRIESIAFTLVNDNNYNDKLDLFHKLFQIGYTYELVEDVHKLICQFLLPTRKHIYC